MRNFCEVLKEIRKAKGKTQQKVADYLGVTCRMVQFYEGGDRYPDVKGLIKLADYFDVSLDYLVGRSPNPKFDRWE